jgi:hypothetical protein
VNNVPKTQQSSTIGFFLNFAKLFKSKDVNMNEYIVKVYNDGSRYYYRNGLLHRETGPAILIPEDQKYFNESNDDHLYKEAIVEEDAPYKIFNQKPIMYLPQPTGSFKRYHTMPVYYLNGEGYSDEEFAKIKAKLVLKNELSIELPKTESNSKKLKI